jgi:hypothetical protein
MLGRVPRRVRASVLLLISLCGCAGAPARRVESVESLRVSALVVEPLRTSGAVPAEESIAFSDRLGLRAVATASGRALVWGPREIHPLHPERPDWTANDALTSLRAAAIAPTEVLFLRSQLERASAEGRQEVRGRGNADGASAEWVYRARVELLHPSSGRVVVESTAEARVDPFRAEDPGVGPLLDRVVDDALAGLEGRWAGPLRPALDAWRVLAVDAETVGLEGEVKRLGWLRLANPGLGEEEAARLLRLPPGVLVRTTDLPSQLHAGDLVTTLDGAPAGLEALERTRLRAVRARLEVRTTSGGTRHVRWP